jgi:DNA-binding NarL/FixJ family response regulator
MVDQKIKDLAEAKAHLAQLEQAIAAELSRELAGLPAQFGFDDVDAFVAAVRTAASRKSRRGRGPTKIPPTPTGQKRRKRVVITEAMRAEVKQLLAAGKSGAKIAQQIGISLPSVQKIKNALGLVKKRK